MHKDEIDIIILHPVNMIGPSTNLRVNTSVNTLILPLLTGDMSFFPNIKLSLVDVRDVAVAHIKALELDIKKAKRIIISSQGL